MERSIHEELSGREDPDEVDGLSYYTKGQMYRGDSLLIKVKIKEGTPEEVAKDMADKEGGSFSHFKEATDGLEDDEAYIVSGN